MKFGLTYLRASVRDGIRALRGTYFFRVLGLMILMLFLASAAMYQAEHEHNSTQGFWDAFWWAIVTVTTVGYGDVVPKTAIGRAIGIGVMFSGLLLVSLLTATAASVFVTRKIKEGKGLETVRDRDHIVICGWNENGAGVIKGLENHLRPKVPVIVLVNELPREEVDAIEYRFRELEFRYVRGNFTKEEILARANLRRARAALILADSSGGYPLEKADERTIFGALAVKSMAPKVKTCAELTNPENREHLSRAQVDEIVVRGEHNAAILAGAAAASGLSTVMKRLMDLDEPNKLWRARIQDKFVGRTVADLAEHFTARYSAILLAVVTETGAIQLEDILSPDHSAIDNFIKRKFEESGKNFFGSGKGRMSVQINPSRDYVITKNDSAIVLGKVRPGEGSILEKSIDIVTGGSRGESK